MKIYLAARYSRNDEMRGVRDVLTALGHEVTSRWIDLHPGVFGDQRKLEQSFTPEFLGAETEFCGRVAQIDIDDLFGANALVCFTTGQVRVSVDRSTPPADEDPS